RPLTGIADLRRILVKSEGDGKHADGGQRQSRLQARQGTRFSGFRAPGKTPQTRWKPSFLARRSSSLAKEVHVCATPRATSSTKRVLGGGTPSRKPAHPPARAGWTLSPLSSDRPNSRGRREGSLRRRGGTAAGGRTGPGPRAVGSRPPCPGTRRTSSSA